MKKQIIVLFITLFSISNCIAQIKLSGVVQDEAGKALRGVQLVLSPGNYSDVSDASGAFSMDDIPSGIYLLTADYAYTHNSKYLELSQDTNLVLELNRSILLDQVMVTSIRKGSAFSIANETLSATEISKKAGTPDIPYLLESTPSFVASSDAGAGVGYTSMRVRGTDQTRINVTLNGIPLNDAESQNVFWVDLPDLSSGTQSIQVQRGVGSSTQGASAFGASVNLSTHELKDEAEVTLSGQYGSFDTKKGGVAFSSGKLSNHFYLNGRLSRISSDGYIDRASSELGSYALSAAYVTEGISLRYNILSGHERTYQAWYGIDGETLENNRTFNPAGTEKAGTPYEDQVDDYQQVHHQFHLNADLTDEIQLGVAAHYTLGEGFYEEYKASEYLDDYNMPIQIVNGSEIIESDLVRRRWLDNDFYGFVFNASYKASEQLQLTLGGGWNHYEGKHFGEVIWAQYASTIDNKFRYYDNVADKSDFNVFLKSELNLSNRFSTYLDLQMRSVNYAFKGPDQNGSLTDQAADYNFFNPKIGLKYALMENATLFFSSGIAQKEPNRDDHIDSTPESRPNSELLWDNELGLAFNPQAGLRLGLNAYYMLYKDQLVLTGELNDVGAYTRVNVDDSYRMGIEMTADFKPLDRLDIKANLSLSQNKIDNFIEFLDEYDADFNYIGQQSVSLGKTDIAFSPELIASFFADYKMIQTARTEFGLFTDIKLVGEQYIDNSSDENNKIGSYKIVTAGLFLDVRQVLGKSLKLKATVRNLFDQQYVSNAWSYKYIYDNSVAFSQGYYPQAGRHYEFGIELKF
jgi:iron complex outermembrane receptor protein